ncbi:hypothetical protein IAQ61_005302 [Plenodomus lingam]|uniref:uncharacterized protein n=1 Tax=Leptosphaeria maculans TaxID=5022 RepID=UPI00331EF6EB|nr:hypothetical protein IAQ61_005302 [Plenodomus lingam]
MATAVQSAMTMQPFNAHANQCIDPDQDIFDFSQFAETAPTSAHLKRESISVSAMTSPTTTAIDDELQTPAKPSHEYERFKQQTGIPSGSLAGLGAAYNTGFPMFNNSGLDLMGTDSAMDGAWNTGLPLESNVNMGMDFQQPGYFFNDASQDDFVDPSAIQQEEVPNVRVWPGMHQQQAQQAALAKAQAQAQQQRAQQLAQQKQQQLIQQQKQQQQQQQQQQTQHQRLPSTSQASRKLSSPLSDARTEETIARVVAQIRADSQNASNNGMDGNQGLLPHVIRAKKDEEDMDEDERLLASEEGKKLSSKERRQLRNKVSARAFRSRRKEYIGQLEGEVAVKVQEANELRNQNRLLMEENARSRAFIERLLRHQAFGPFLEELSRDEALQPKTAMTTVPSSAPAAAAPASAPFPAQQFGAMPQENTRVGMTMVPEPQLDFSTLNINNNGNNWASNNGFNYQQPRVFAVLEVPEGPSNPLDTEAMSGKGYSAIFNAEDDCPADEIKPDFPVIERPIESTATIMTEMEDDSEFDLYSLSPTRSASTANPNATAPAAPEDHEILFANPEKALAHYSLVLTDEAQEALLDECLERRIAAMEPVLQRVAAITSMFDL